MMILLIFFINLSIANADRFKDRVSLNEEDNTIYEKDGNKASLNENHINERDVEGDIKGRDKLDKLDKSNLSRNNDISLSRSGNNDIANLDKKAVKKSVNRVSLDEAIDLFKNSSKQAEQFKKSQELEERAYNMCRWQRYLGVFVEDNTIYKKDGDKAILSNNISPTISILDLSFTPSIQKDGVNGWGIVPYSYSLSYALSELIWSSKAYTLAQVESDRNINKMLNDRAWGNSVDELTDLFVNIKILEEQLEMRKRNLDLLLKDQKYVDGKLLAGTASKLDVKLIKLEVEKAEKDVANINRNIEINRDNLFNKLGVHIELGEVNDVDVEVTFSDKTIPILEEQIKNGEAILNSYNKNHLPNLGIALTCEKVQDNTGVFLNEFQMQFNVNFSWNILGDTSSSIAAKREVLSNKNELVLAKLDYELKKKSLFAEYTDMIEELKAAELEKAYLDELKNIKHDMFLGGLISLSDYLEFFNKHKDQESDCIAQKYKIVSFKKKNS